MSSTACWKKVWLTVIGDSKAVTITEARNVLGLVKAELLEGLAQYKPYKEDSLDLIPLLSTKLKEKGSTLEHFLQKLNFHTNLQSDFGWKMFCNFLIFEYYGKVEDIQKIAEYELFNTHLFRQIWLFYSSERMFMIKIMKHILENANNKEHKFQVLYKEFLDEIQITEIRSSLLKQFVYLMEEIRRGNQNCCLEYKDWVSRNNREQLEILHSLILTAPYKQYTIDEFITFLDICKKHCFGKEPENDYVLAHSDPNVVKVNRLVQLATLVVATKPFWLDSDDWLDRYEEIEDKILKLECQQQQELSILVLLFISLQLTTDHKGSLERFSKIYAKHVTMALEQKVFHHLYKLTSLADWEDTRAGSIVKDAVFTFAQSASYNFEGDVTILNFEGVADLIAELAKEPQLAIKMVHANNIYNKFYTTMIRMFPHSFVPFSMVITQLLSHKELFNHVFNQINNFTIYTEFYQTIPMESDMITRQDYQPKEHQSFKILKGTKAEVKEILGNSFVMFEYRYTYFDVLEDMSNSFLSGQKDTMKMMSLIHLGYKCLFSILSTTSANQYDTMTKSLNLIQPIMLRASVKPLINLELVATSLDIYRLLLHREPEKITDSLMAYSFLPQIIKDRKYIDHFFEDNFLNTSIVFLAIREEINTGKMSLLFSYVRFLKELSELNTCVRKVLTPGLGFLFIHIFPLHLSLNYESMSQKQQLSDECLRMMLNLFQNDYNNLQEDDKILYDFCFQLIVDHGPTVEMLYKLLWMTNTYLNICTMNESNWEKRSSIVQIQCLKKVLAIINILLSLHNKGERSLKGTKFLSFLLDSSIKPSSLKLITSYIQHMFDPMIPKLSCQILKKLAVNSDVTMLSLLEMNKYQLQCTFLEKLRDPLEEESLKVAILDLITLCVEKQNGMIVAFFDISQLSETNHSAGDSVTAFMEEYLVNIRKSTDYLYSPIQAAVLDLFHSLWMYRKNMLVADLTQNEGFWMTLMDPLFKDLKLPNKTYTQILNILTYELFRSKGTNVKINQVIHKLFSSKDTYTSAWCEHMLKPDGEIYRIQFLRSWKNLLIATCKNSSDALSDITCRQLLTKTCLDGILQHFSEQGDVRILAAWAETYLYLITQWPKVGCEDKSKVLHTLTRMLKYLEGFYSDVGDILKEIVLAIAVKTVKDLHNVESDTLAMEEYLHAIGKLLEKEFDRIISIGHKQTDLDENKISSIHSIWVLLITFGTYLLESQLNLCQQWFKTTQFLQKCLKSIGSFIRNSLYFPIAKIMVQCLLAYASSPLIDHFLYENLESFFDDTLPPERFINTSGLNYKNAMPWHFEDWWLTYTGIVQLMTVLLNKLGPFILRKLFSFALVHADLMKNVMKLPKVTVERSALQLVSVCLNFCHLLLQWKVDWKLYSPNIYSTYLEAVNETINAITYVVLRPTVAKFFSIEKETALSFIEDTPTGCLVEIMDALMEIIVYGCLCLLRACPSMVELLSPIPRDCDIDVFVDDSFTIPKMYDDTASRLKYGTLLCLLHFLSKALQVTKPGGGGNADLDTLDTINKSGCIAFVCPDYFGVYSIIDKYNSLQTFAGSDVSKLSTTWLTRLNHEKVKFALETLTSFLAVQTYLTVYVCRISPSKRYHIKRELCSELLYFQEFTRKRAPDHYQYKTIDNIVYRKLYTEPIPYFPTVDTGGNDMLARAETPFHKQEISNFLKVLKLEEMEHVTTGQIFYKRDDFFSIIVLRNPPQEGCRRSMRMKPRYCGFNEDELVIIERLTLSYPREYLIHNEGDYLLLLSHWFFHICQLSH